MSFIPLDVTKTFPELINKIYTIKLNDFCIVYLDDILINTKQADSAIVKIVKWILEQLCGMNHTPTNKNAN